MILVLKAPVLIALLSYLPVLLLAAHFLVAVSASTSSPAPTGSKATQGRREMAIAWLPYQMVLAYAALRATAAPDARPTDWEKTRTWAPTATAAEPAGA